ncbi:DUF2059 domain-containing protein [Vibrio sp. S9_S30]|uniref:DUF2059 domain-containing protein n=1 Tax=Vibrio sp. S9_S30 TaxID=2720226 RepID=UPI0016804883|nr:DUF2059 domain-containing protein [Vibrio sp. S9_S30]MBD1559993.1 DUF2059 domain-containing protein [Vibrio sp. S9_S30]
MKVIKYLKYLILFSIFFAIDVYAVVSERHREEALKFVEIEYNPELMSGTLVETIRHSSSEEIDFEPLGRFFNIYFNRMDFKEEMAQAYVKYFDVDEIILLREFYSTELGLKLKKNAFLMLMKDDVPKFTANEIEQIGQFMQTGVAKKAKKVQPYIQEIFSSIIEKALGEYSSYVPEVKN